MSPTRSDILNELVNSVSPPAEPLDEAGLAQAAIGLAKQAAPYVALAAPIYLALRKGKLPTSARPSQALGFAKQMMKARTKPQAVAAAAGLLHVCAKVMLSVPELRDLGHKINSIVLSPSLAEYLGE